MSDFATQPHYDAAAEFLRHFHLPAEEPSLPAIGRILAEFARLPYENLSKIIKYCRCRDVNHLRFPGELLADHQRFQLGGTCFALTFFLKTILDSRGYETFVVMADMRSGANSHCALVLNFGGRQYLLDPGYLIRRPLPLDGTTPGDHYYFTVESDPCRLALWTPSGRQIRKRYTFRVMPTAWQNFHQFWQDSFHWMTMHGICLSKRDADGFLYLHNHYVKREGRDMQFKGHFNEPIAELARLYFDIPPETVSAAESALRENLYSDRELGYQVPAWIK